MAVRYWVGPLEHDGAQTQGIWEERRGAWFPVPDLPMWIYGDLVFNRVPVFKTSPENFVDFLPEYRSRRVLSFLLERGACFDGAVCWAQLPPPLLAYQALVQCADPKTYPHEAKFYGALRRKFPAAFAPGWVSGVGRPGLDWLRASPSRWGL